MRDQARSLLWLPAGPLLAQALEALDRSPRCPQPHTGQSPPGELEPGHARGRPCACMIVVAAAWEACGAWAAAGSATAVVDAAGRSPVVLDVPASRQQITDPAREELAPALRTSPNAMGNRINAARQLVGHPRLLALVASAAISAWAARLVVLELADLNGEQSARVVQEVCDRVIARQDSGRRAWTSAEVGRAARMIRRRLCPESDRATRERAFCRRRVQVLPDRNGMAVLVADLDETDAHRVHLRLTALARGLKDRTESRTVDQIRADALVDLLLGQPQTGTRTHDAGRTREPAPAATGAYEGSGVVGDGVGDAAGVKVGLRDRLGTARADAAEGNPATAPRPEIHVVVSLATLMGLSEDPGELAGGGTIPPERARELAADGRWRAWVTDSAGAVVAVGSAGYVPSAGLARQVRARERFCRMPGCRHSAQRCDLDHTVPYPLGPTNAANLGPLCRRHHNLKTHLGWQLEAVDVEADLVAGPDPDGPGAACAQEGWESSTPVRGASATPEGGTACAQAGADSAPAGWRWRTPAGFTITDQPTHPLE